MVTGVGLPAAGGVEERGAGAGEDLAPPNEDLEAVSTGGCGNCVVHARRYGRGWEGGGRSACPDGEDGIIDGGDDASVDPVRHHEGGDTLGDEEVSEPLGHCGGATVPGDWGASLGVERDGGGVQVHGDLGGGARAGRGDDHEGELDVLEEAGLVNL